MQQSRIERDAAPRIGFVSLGCPKALVDSEQILTQLRAEGYTIAPSYAGAGFGRRQHLRLHRRRRRGIARRDRRALAENGGKVVVGTASSARRTTATFVRNARASEVLAASGPACDIRSHVGRAPHVPKPHDPFVDLVPRKGIKLTPSHYAYLKISEGCNHRCVLRIIPAMRAIS
jgi:ribosomal protein S12 methylthiotransferase